MIWKRFIASQMVAATYKKGTIDIVAGDNLFRALGESLLFPGWLALYGATGEEEEETRKKDSKDSDDQTELINLPELEAGDQLILDRLEPEQKFTQPPARYTEASLISEMEKLGIGRPSTYAPTISTLFDRLYVEREARQLKPTELGVTVTVMLEEHFRNIVDTDFTAKMESELDEVESGSRDWVEVLRAFYGPFHEDVIKAKKNAEKIVIEVVPTGKKCPECKEGDLVFRDGRYGKFIACSRFPECKFTEAISEPTNAHCPQCGSVIRERKIRRGNKLYFCEKTKDPECDFTSFDLPIDDKFCETCNSYMVLKRFRGRTYERCSNKECASNKKTAKKSKDSTDKSED
jgi:DNA topoisomerase-1